MPTLKLEDRELLTIADLISDALERVTGDNTGLYGLRSLVRLALVIHQAGGGRSHRLAILHGAPPWVYRYLGKSIIDLAPAAAAGGKKPKKK